MAKFATGEATIVHFLFSSKRMAWVWLVVRLYVGYEWLVAGIAKVTSPVWLGAGAGGAVKGFAMGALAKTGGEHPDVQWWYVWFLQHVVLPHASLFSNMVAVGEVAVGAALVLGCLTGVAAFFGMFMNLNYLLAGTVSINPQLFVLQLFLVLGYRFSGYIGLDRYVLPGLRACRFWR
jgi:thiosulfate dehydrogenase [quinone] large subunit